MIKIRKGYEEDLDTVISAINEANVGDYVLYCGYSETSDGLQEEPRVVAKIISVIHYKKGLFRPTYPNLELQFLNGLKADFLQYDNSHYGPIWIMLSSETSKYKNGLFPHKDHVKYNYDCFGFEIISKQSAAFVKEQIDKMYSESEQRKAFIQAQRAEAQRKHKEAEEAEKLEAARKVAEEEKNRIASQELDNLFNGNKS